MSNSFHHFAIRWKPTGMLFSSRPIGVEIPGIPVICLKIVFSTCVYLWNLRVYKTLYDPNSSRHPYGRLNIYNNTKESYKKLTLIIVCIYSDSSRCCCRSRNKINFFENFLHLFHHFCPDFVCNYVITTQNWSILNSCDKIQVSLINFSSTSGTITKARELRVSRKQQFLANN